MGIVAEEVLPSIFKDTPISVIDLTDQQRYELGLASTKTIVEVIGDNSKVAEAVDYARTKGRIGFDTETTGRFAFGRRGVPRDRIVLVQLGDSERQYVIWHDTVDVTPITELLMDKSVIKIGQALKFDAVFWHAEHGLDKPVANVVDAMLVEQILGCGLFAVSDDDGVGMTLKMTSMEQLALRWLGLQIPKDEELRTGWGNYAAGTLSRDKLYYAADDVCVPAQVLKKQAPWIRKLGLVKTVNLEHLTLPVTAWMEARGMKLKEPVWRALADEAVNKARQAQLELDRIFNIRATIDIDEKGRAVVARDKLYNSHEQLKNLINEWMLKHTGRRVIITNQHFKDALLAGGEINPARLDKLFEKRLVEDPTTGRRKQVGYPDKSDIVDLLWKDYSEYLPPNSSRLPDTSSKTLRLYKIIYETPEQERDIDNLPDAFGLPSKLVDPILNFRLYSKRSGTYGYNWFDLISDETSRIHADFIQGALSTGRYSATPNSMNFPRDKRYRDAFEPEPGYLFVGGDWSQIEPRVTAEMSMRFGGDPTYMRVFWSERPGSLGFERWCPDVTEPLDLYTEVGKRVGVIPEHFTLKDVKGALATKEGLRGRHQSKIIVLGLTYGTGVHKFHITLIIDTNEHHKRDYAERLHTAFFESVPVVKKSLDYLSWLVGPNSKRRVYHPIADTEVTYSEAKSGRKRFFHPKNKHWYTAGRNHPIQALAGGDILKKTTVLMAHWLWENNIDGYFVNLIHDELLLEVREDQAEMAKNKLHELMVAVGESYCEHVPIAASNYAGLIWQKD